MVQSCIIWRRLLLFNYKRRFLKKRLFIFQRWYTVYFFQIWWSLLILWSKYHKFQKWYATNISIRNHKYYKKMDSWDCLSQQIGLRGFTLSIAFADRRRGLQMFKGKRLSGETTMALHKILPKMQSGFPLQKRTKRLVTQYLSKTGVHFWLSRCELSATAQYLNTTKILKMDFVNGFPGWLV